MQLQSLGYVGIAADKLEDWSAFATGLLGMQVIERGNSGLALRMDDRKQRLLVDRDSRNGCNFYGWEVVDAAALDTFAAHLEEKGVAVTREPRAVADRRCVTDLISFNDPMGNRFEVF